MSVAQIIKPFGVGSDLKEISKPRLSSEPEIKLQGNLKHSMRNPNQSMETLQRAARASSSFLQETDEKAVSSGHRIFDQAFSGNLLAQAPSSAGVGIGPGDRPENLKENDPRIQLKKFEPPKISQVKDVESPEQNLLGQQIMMMVLSAAIGGILGPVFSGLGAGMARGMGLIPPNPDGGSNIRSQSPLLSNN
jgi:hypothetical protein